MKFLDVTNLKFENAQMIGKQLKELMEKIENSKFPVVSGVSVFQSESEKEFVEQSAKASNEYAKREALKKKNPNER